MLHMHALAQAHLTMLYILLVYIHVLLSTLKWSQHVCYILCKYVAGPKTAPTVLSRYTTLTTPTN